jgi:hypothetical protein
MKAFLVVTFCLLGFFLDALSGTVVAQQGCWMVAIKDAQALDDTDARVKKGTNVFMVDRTVDSDGTVEVSPLVCGCSYDAKNLKELSKCNW